MADLQVNLKIDEKGQLLLQSNGPAEAVFELLQRAQAAIFHRLLDSVTTGEKPEPSRIIPVAGLPPGIKL